jgi:hypothetical protein
MVEENLIARTLDHVRMQLIGNRSQRDLQAVAEE